MHDPLTRALIPPEHEHLYRTNAWFKTGIDLLSRFLPALVDGLAWQAEAKNAEMQGLIEAVQRGPFDHKQMIAPPSEETTP